MQIMFGSRQRSQLLSDTCRSRSCRKHRHTCKEQHCSEYGLLQARIELSQQDRQISEVCYSMAAMAKHTHPRILQLATCIHANKDKIRHCPAVTLCKLLHQPTNSGRQCAVACTQTSFSQAYFLISQHSTKLVAQPLLHLGY